MTLALLGLVSMTLIIGAAYLIGEEDGYRRGRRSLGVFDDERDGTEARKDER